MRSRWLAFVCLALAVLAAPALLFAQDADKTGIAGALIDHWFLPVVALLQSVATKGIAYIAPAWKKLSEPIKWTVLYAVGIAITFVGRKFGFMGVISGDNLSQLGTAGVLAAFPTTAAALIYKLGGHKVPSSAFDK